MGEYRTTTSYATALRIMFAVWAVLAGLTAAVQLTTFRVLRRFIANPFSLSFEQAEMWDERSVRLGIVLIAASLVAGVLFATWLWRSYKNLEAFGVAPVHKTSWAFWGWIVPFMNLVRPKQIVDEMWLASSPGLPAGTRDDHPVIPMWVHAWWAVFLLSRVAAPWFETQFGDSFDVDAAARDSLILGIISLLEIGGAVLAFWLVTRATERQEQKAHNLGLVEEAVQFRPASGRRVLLGGMIVASLMVCAVSMVLFHEADATTLAEVETIDGGDHRYDAHDVSFEYPASMVAAESGLIGDGSEATIDMGQVVVGSVASDLALVVMWSPFISDLTEAETSDLLADIADASASGYESPLVERGVPESVEGAMGPFIVRPFVIRAEGEEIAFEAAAATCADSSRGVAALAMGDDQRRARAELEDLLATLRC